jgi:hypothetical protein
MRVVSSVLALTVLALSGCAVASSDGDSRSLAGAWQGISTNAASAARGARGTRTSAW